MQSAKSAKTIGTTKDLLYSGMSYTGSQQQSTKKGYFREGELFRRAVNVNLHNNLKLKSSLERGKARWHMGREDLLCDFKANSQLHFPEAAMPVSYVVPSGFSSPALPHVLRHHSLRLRQSKPKFNAHSNAKDSQGPRTLEEAENPKEAHETSAGKLSEETKEGSISTLAFPAIEHQKRELSLAQSRNSVSIYSNVQRGRNGVPESPSEWAHLAAIRSNELLRFFIRRIATKAKTEVRNTHKPWGKYQASWKRYATTTETEELPTIDVLRPSPSASSSSKYSNTSSKHYNMINGLPNSAYPGGLSALLQKCPSALRRKCTVLSRSQETAIGSNLNHTYQQAVQHDPNVFKRVGDLLWHEAVTRKSYKHLLRTPTLA